jgi:trimethylamine---corrinoid protein Co-methyltransferase
MKKANTASFSGPQFALLSESQLNDIHLASLEILRRTGVRFEHKEALTLLKNAGAFVADGNLVRFPPCMIERAIGTAPERIVLCNRSGEPTMFLEGTNVYFGGGSDTLHYLDPFSGELRKWTTKDICNAYRLCDSLPNIHFLMSIGIPTDVPEGVSHYQWQFANMLQYSGKPSVVVCDDRNDLEAIIEMASLFREDKEDLRRRPNILLYSEPTSPLQQSKTALDKLLLMAEIGLPVVHSPAPMMGSSGPIHLAGELALCNAEILSGLVLHQLKNPGAPFVYGAGPHHFDMRSVQICYGAPEFQLTKAAIAELGRYYKMPTWGYAGCSDAKVLDEQAAVEATMAALMAKLSGANLVHDVGYMESGLATSLELILLTDELVAMIDHMMSGIVVSDDTLMINEIDAVGPGENFLTTKETVARFREFWNPQFFDRDSLEKWNKAGALTTSQRLNRKVKDIIENYEVERVQDTVIKEMTSIMERHRPENKRRSK